MDGRTDNLLSNIGLVKLYVLAPKLLVFPISSPHPAPWEIHQLGDIATRVCAMEPQICPLYPAFLQEILQIGQRVGAIMPPLCTMCFVLIADIATRPESRYNRAITVYCVLCPYRQLLKWSHHCVVCVMSLQIYRQLLLYSRHCLLCFMSLQIVTEMEPSLCAVCYVHTDLQIVIAMQPSPSTVCYVLTDSD